MMTIPILWALIIALFAIKHEQPRERKYATGATWQAIPNVEWAFWFAVLSPVIGVSLGAFGVFILTH